MKPDSLSPEQPPEKVQPVPKVIEQFFNSKDIFKVLGFRSNTVHCVYQSEDDSYLDRIGKELPIYVRVEGGPGGRGKCNTKNPSNKCLAIVDVTGESPKYALMTRLVGRTPETIFQVGNPAIGKYGLSTFHPWLTSLIQQFIFLAGSPVVLLQKQRVN